ncbi:MAG: ABC transporter ATP-binding protein [Chloroflexota bacterium]|nr:ABC transporter ATP-binding protein [Chloroflexota bacterium]
MNSLREQQHLPVERPSADHVLTAPSLVIDARGVHKRFGGPPVLANLSVQVRAGEIFGLIGPSGSGKTTAIHLCCGHLRPSAGSIEVLGEQPSSFTAATRRRIGYMPQNFILYPDLTIKQNIAFAAGLYGLNEWSHRTQIQATLELVELWEARSRTARAISGGMQRRLALAAALIHAPDLLFADEPTANLDPILRAKLWRHFRSLCEHGRTLVITTQYIDEAEYCDRVGLMFDGALIADGRPEALRRDAFGGDMINVLLVQPAAEAVDTLKQMPTVVGVEVLHQHGVRITVAEAAQTIPVLLDVLEAAGLSVRSITQERPTFDEVFIRLIEQHSGTRPPLGRIQTSAAGEW